MKTDFELIQEMDLEWLHQNGWTVKGNLACRRIIETRREIRPREILTEEIEQIFMRYNLNEKEIVKVQSAFDNLMDIARLFRGTTQADHL